MEKTMKSIVFSGIGRYEILERPVPKIKYPTDVKVKVLAASICGSDVHYLATPPAMEATEGVILGHECVGEVVECAENVHDLHPGDHVILDNNLTCGVCPMCQMGLPNLCRNMQSMGSMIDGIFAEYFVAPQQQLIKISDKVPIDDAVFAEPLNTVMGAVKKLKITPGSSVLILGGGPIGLLFSVVLRAAGAGKVLVSEVSEFRAEYARKSGVDHVINPVKESLKEKVEEYTNGLGADIVIDAVGVLAPDAVDCARKGGQCILFGLNSSKTEVIRQCDITMKGLSVLGSYIGGYALYDVGRLLEAGKLPLQQFITHRLPMEKFGEGLEALRKGEGLEVVLYPFSNE
ncbi:MAG: alcohol dehydrogenase catalytic domain-containing protein [Eubacterium sp.]|nr:alcohol dehydrogenase catalytic domain-containing protein [Eubacterium sp.]